ncbi:MAG: hypothetical protein KC543_14395, partial [Myxococcales bacterium]|nr:hypothetical protein [Myxococcales bacterium]
MWGADRGAASFERLREHTRALASEVRVLVDQAARDPRTAPLVPVLRAEVLSPLEAVLADATAPSPQAMAVLADASRVLGRRFAGLERAVRERALEPAAYLGETDALADAVLAPLRLLAAQEGAPWEIDQVVTTSASGAAPVWVSRAARAAVVRVSPAAARSIEPWVEVAENVGRAVYRADDTFRASLARALGVPLDETLYVPSDPYAYERVGGAVLFGPWGERLFADVFATVTLGPAYVARLRRAAGGWNADQRADAAAAARASGRFDATPPAHLRMWMACRTLDALGCHGEARAEWEAWAAARPDLDAFHLPAAGGVWVRAPLAYLYEPGAVWVDHLTSLEAAIFAQRSLVTTPGLAYLGAARAEVERAIPHLLAGRAVHADPRWIVAAAMAAGAGEGEASRAVFDAVRRSIAGAGEADTHASATWARGAAALEARRSLGASVRAASRDRARLRAAVVLGEALGPR